MRALEARVENEIIDSRQQYSTARELVEDIEQWMLAKARSVQQTTEYSYRPSVQRCDAELQ